MISQTSFDAYFSHATSRAQTSSNVFSALVPPLSQEEYLEGIQSAHASTSKPPPIRPGLLESDQSRAQLFARFLLELNEGFNLLLYGVGSKRQILNRFAKEYCAKVGHVVVASAFRPDFSLKELFTSIEKIPGVVSTGTSTTVENHAKRIDEAFSKPTQKRHLYLIIHNLDAVPLRSQKAKSCLALLAMNPRIHIAASIDHINAPLLWSSSECAARKPTASSQSSFDSPKRGFAWLWHDLTTLEPYDAELAYADRSSISGAHTGSHKKAPEAALLAAQSAGTAMSETAALHILASVTQRAKKLFVLMATRQLESIEEAAGADASGSNTKSNSDLQQHGMGYDALFTAARDNFIATNDTALRALLGEFRDHGLVISAQAGAGSGEILWIPVRKERLSNILQSMEE
ncbi:origin recognition complex, subunit 2 [Amanita rubescens]|nr:origin recognition complex, subunit 2 [Amanita rubescens]